MTVKKFNDRRTPKQWVCSKIYQCFTKIVRHNLIEQSLASINVIWAGQWRRTVNNKMRLVEQNVSELVINQSIFQRL